MTGLFKPPPRVEPPVVCRTAWCGEPALPHAEGPYTRMCRGCAERQRELRRLALAPDLWWDSVVSTNGGGKKAVLA